MPIGVPNLGYRKRRLYSVEQFANWRKVGSARNQRALPGGPFIRESAALVPDGFILCK